MNLSPLNKIPAFDLMGTAVGVKWPAYAPASAVLVVLAIAGRWKQFWER